MPNVRLFRIEASNKEGRGARTFELDTIES